MFTLWPAAVVLSLWLLWAARAPLVLAFIGPAGPAPPPPHPPPGPPLTPAPGPPDPGQPRRVRVWNDFARAWLTHGPFIAALVVALSHAYPQYKEQFLDIAICLGALCGGGTPPPILNGHGIGKLLGVPADTYAPDLTGRREVDAVQEAALKDAIQEDKK